VVGTMTYTSNGGLEIHWMVNEEGLTETGKNKRRRYFGSLDNITWSQAPCRNVENCSYGSSCYSSHVNDDMKQKLAGNMESVRAGYGFCGSV